MLSKLRDFIENHSVMSIDGVFAKMAKRKLVPSILADFMCQTGAVCEASRPGLSLGASLRQLGFVSQADQVELIFCSEAGHEYGYDDMTKSFLVGSSEVSRSYKDFDWLRTPAVERVRAVFARRAEVSREAVLYSLGVILVVEIFAHRRFIPAMVAASRQYGLVPEEIPYLAEHAGEGGAEFQHELTIIALLGSFEGLPEFSEGDWQLVCNGCESILAAFADWLSELDQILHF